MTAEDTYFNKIPWAGTAKAAENILIEARRLLRARDYLLIAVDGRCAAGKSTLAAHLRERSGCNVIPMDSFFLRTQQRTRRRLLEPGGNVDYERFFKEVLVPLKKRAYFSYRPYDCRNQKAAAAVTVMPKQITVIEGSYSLHPMLAEHYDLKVFLTVDPEEQLRRLTCRNEKMVPVFRKKWIPLEEYYFRECHIPENCGLCYELKD